MSSGSSSTALRTPLQASATLADAVEAGPVEFVTLDWRGRTVSIEHQWLRHTATPGEVDSPRPLIVFLHEGLGSRSMWRDFPARLCAATGADGLVYSRPGYGRSTPRAADEHWAPDFMHRQAHEVLPALLQALGVDGRQRPLWLFGHSDGGSITLLHAQRPDAHLTGAVVLAPHILVEDLSVASITAAREAYLTTDLRSRLGRHHDDPDSAFWGWNGIWLHPDFRQWRITAGLETIACPLLAVQGLDDEYGTLEQIRGIARVRPGTRLLELPDCGHSPHKDQPQALIDAVVAFMRTAAASPKPPG